MEKLRNKIILFLLILFVGAYCNTPLRAETKSPARAKTPSAKTPSARTKTKTEINALWNAYYTTAKYYNPSLKDKEAREIVNNVIYYSYQYNLDPRFVMAVITIESSFNPRAVSPCGALGIGQIMPENLEAYGVTEPFSPNENIRIMVRMLKLNYDRFKRLPYANRVYNTLAAYNAGYGAVLKYGGVPPYKETQNYVRLVIKVWRKFCGLR